MGSRESSYGKYCLQGLAKRQTGPSRSQFKVLELNNVGVVNGESKWQSISKALKNGWESDFGDVIQRDGVIGRNFNLDANSDGLFDRGQREAYRILADSKQALTLFSANGEKLSVLVLSVGRPFRLWKSRKDFRFCSRKVLEKRSSSSSYMSMTRVLQLNRQNGSNLPRLCLLAGMYVLSHRSLHRPTVVEQSMRRRWIRNDNEGQLIYTATASDESSVTFSLESLDDGSLSVCRSKQIAERFDSTLTPCSPCRTALDSLLSPPIWLATAPVQT